MTVEVYKPVLKQPTPLQSAPIRSVYKPARTPQVSTTTPPARDIKPTYNPIKPRLDLIIGIEAMTHPNEPSFAELEGIILTEDLGAIA